MDHSFSYHHLLAQMPTDQREHEHQQHRVSVQTGLYQMATSDNSPQPYHPGPPVENWSAFRSNLVPDALISLHPEPGFSNPWGATPEPYDFGTFSLTRVPMPDNTYLASFYSTPHANMHRLSSSAPRRSEHDDLMNWQPAPTASSLLSQGYLEHIPSYPDTPEQSTRSMRATPASPPISISSSSISPRHSRDSESMSPAPTVPAAESTSPRISLGDSSDQEYNGGSPYSRLIWEALISTEDKMLPLQGIYQWFEKNTTKGGNEESKGWQNSIRHNLSMNAGFEAIKVEAPGKKAANYWRLTEEAIRNGGVQSTTRYRKMSAKKTLISDPDPRRQQPESKGGKKCAGVKRHATEDEEEPSCPRLTLHLRNVRQKRSPPYQSQSQPHPHHQPPPPPQPLSIDTDIHHLPHYDHSYLPTPSVGLPQYAGLNMPNGLPNGLPNDIPNSIPNGLPPMPRNNWHQFDLSSVIGTTNPPSSNNMVFCDAAEGGPECPAFVCPWVGITQDSGSNHDGLMTGPPRKYI